MPARAAAAALLACGCAAEDPALRQELAALRAEVKALRQESDETARKVDALASRVDLLAAERPSPAPVAAAKEPAAQPEPLVPTRLKVVRLKPEQVPARAARPVAAKAQAKPPPVPTATPVQEPNAAALAALGVGGADLAAEARDALAAARELSGLAQALALEKFTARYPGHQAAQESLVGAAKARTKVGDPDGACEDYARAVADYPAGASMPEALSGLAWCEARAGRADEAKRLEARLAQDFPTRKASGGVDAHAPAAAQGAAP
ncbi:MAG TPA: hypothetical protein VMT17_11460 [Anaeromyxobacteraceae bacterium]|nr:hypothetical protein [Anaeromyxobacteraceae bacterium]